MAAAGVVVAVVDWLDWVDAGTDCGLDLGILDFSIDHTWAAAAFASVQYFDQTEYVAVVWLEAGQGLKFEVG